MSSELTSTATRGFKFNQTMLRIRDPEPSLAFYREVLGMTLLSRADFPAYRFTLYFLGYGAAMPWSDEVDPRACLEATFDREAVLELTHNWGTETDPDFAGYHSGNEDPRGFGHIGITVPDVYAACDWFRSQGVSFVKAPDDGAMKRLAFIRDPDGYWIEILEAAATARLCTAEA